MTPLAPGVFPYPLRGEWDLSASDVRFTLTDPFVYDDAEKAVKVYVPSGTVTDFSSVPRVLWSWFAPTEFPAAGVVHDQMYRHPHAFSRGTRIPLTRGQCDDIYRRILHLSGCRKSKRLAAWSGLRIGGWAAWNKYRKAERGE